MNIDAELLGVPVEEPWAPAVRALLRHLESAGFDGAPPVDGDVTGAAPSWPEWSREDDTLWQVAQWLREYHEAVADFVPPAGAVWRKGGAWEPGLIIGHNDAAPYNATRAGRRLTGFVGWDFAGPVTRDADLAFAAFAWVPLTSHDDEWAGLADRPRRLRMLLDAYGWRGTTTDMVREVRDRISAAIHDIRRLATAGDHDCRELIHSGRDLRLAAAVKELATFPG
ncbi:aminoglycoside phosphotransferase family protein [Actinoplanes sp. NEAU-A12]|uniref:Aminoglycoside phosphotransferase family protein n=1 Tax=Actinoplanes sandaracinus TaxID=3045177 RepID=A0ABT6WXF4_9ACTN|nr:aminoglycoside phosphotransferase family protein [Actinoplanes sandaracinus]MDI6104422.1 aminoglycoside phosphotransferase family protein [Actinoplanes sandaracinus]